MVRNAAKASLALVLSLTVTLYGCSFASFVAAAEADLPVVQQIVVNITNVVAPGVSTEIQAAGSLALAALQVVCGTPAIGASKCDPTSLIGQYQASGSTDASLLAKIQAALATVNSHLTDMLALAKNLSSTVAAAIVTAVGLALSTVTSILSLIPASPTPASLKATLAHATRPPSARKLKSQYNAAVKGQFPSAVIR